MRYGYCLPIFLCAFFSLLSTNAHPCGRWGNPQKIAVLDSKIFPEASGIEVSDKFRDRIYHVNDSGKQLELITTDLKGKNPRKILIKGYNNRKSDNEDLSTGPCFWKSCIFIGDIGDNLVKRSEIRIVVITERKNFPSAVSPLKVLRLRYPDGPHNAESLAVHPNGDIYIISKESDFKTMKYSPSNIYRIRKKIWESNKGALLTPELLGNIDTSVFNGGDRFFLDNIITSLDISKDGKKFLLLTYQDAYEINTDLSNIKPDSFKNADKLSFRHIKLMKLPQQESIAYMNSDKSFLYDTEYIKNHDVDLYRVDCLDN